jgi:hypothetical protein
MTTAIEPDEEAFRNIEHDYPNASAAKKFQLMQAEVLLRQNGYVRQADGTYEKPARRKNKPRSKSTTRGSSLPRSAAR